LEVEAVEFIAGLLRIHNILIDDKGGTLGGVCDALANLAIRKEKVSVIHLGEA
jgi:hypothetical protein